MNVQIRNDSGEAIPAFGVLAVTGVVQVKQRIVYTVDKPDATTRPVLINSVYPVKADGYGEAQDGLIVSGHFDDTDTPIVGDEMGAVDASWKLTPGGSGWTFLGRLGTDRIGMFQRSEGGFYLGKPDTAFTAGLLTAPNNVVSKWKGPAWGAEDADTGKNIEVDYALQDFATTDYVTVTWSDGKWYVGCFLAGA